jgi:ribosome-associated toxin RatA of RatAB toxin-antitoxin module
MPSAQAVETFNCEPGDFYKIVSDYERYPEFLSEVKSCRVLREEGERKLVEYKVSVLKSFTYQLWMSERPSTAISWEFAGGDLFKTSSGSWKLESDGADRTRASYAVEATFALFVPGPIAKTLLTVNLPTMMAAYHKRVKEIYGK